MAKNEGLVPIALLPILMMAIPAQVQASQFKVYDGLLFKMYYPSGWIVNQTGTVKQGNVTFYNGTQSNKYNDTRLAFVWVSWSPGNISMNTDSKNAVPAAPGWVRTMVNNDSYYLLGQRALVIDANNGMNENMRFVTSANGTTYNVYYTAAIDNFLAHLSQFRVMVASFSINGHVPFSGMGGSNQRLYPHHKP